MPKHHALPLSAPSRHSRVIHALDDRARSEWEALKPAAILVAIFAGLVMIDGLLTIGLFGLLDALGLHEPPEPGAIREDG